MRNRCFINLKEMSSILVKSTMLLLFSITVNFDLMSQCSPDGTSPTFVNCSPRTVALSPGQCVTALNPQLYATDNCPAQTGVITNNVGNVNSGYGCDQGVTHFYEVLTTNNATPMRLNSITFGVYKASGTYNIPVRVYITDGSTNVANWELIASGTAAGVTGSNTSATANINSGRIMPGDEIAIEIIAPATIAGDTVVGYSAPTLTTGTSYYVSKACGVLNLANLSTISSAASLDVEASYTAESVFIVPSGSNTYQPDDHFAVGTYSLSYIAYDATGNSSNCLFNLTVNAINNPVTSISCNDVVNISLDEECEAIVGADEILEGGPYSCYEDYEVIIYNAQNRPIGDTLNMSYVGQKLRVEVVGPNGNKCWGEIMVEDKAPPVLDCFDVYTSCNGSLEPGSALPARITYEAEVPNDKIGGGAPSSNVYYINVFGLQNVTVNDVNVTLDIEHTDVSQLSATLESPEGTFVNLFGALTCTNADMKITLDAQAAQTFADLQNDCNATSPALSNSYKAWGNLNAYNGEDPTGRWKLTLNDNVSGDGGIVKSLKIVISQNGGQIPFPTMNDVTFTKTGENNYLVNGLDPCGPATVSYFDAETVMDCESRYWKVITRRWTAVDVNGNQAKPCDQKIYVYRNGLETLQWPIDYTGNNTLSCSQWGMQVPPADATGTGAPTGDFCENIQIFEPEDTKIDICAKSYKLVRKWKILEWCSSEVLEHTQIIKVEDKEGPSVSCPDDVTLSTDPLDCSLDYTAEEPSVSDNGCSSEDQIDIQLSYYSSENGSLPANAIFTVVSSGNEIEDLPVGVTFIKWTATDDCGNSSSCTYKVTVRDEVPPVAVCDQFTNVSVGSDGRAEVAAIVFDDLSYDNCELVDYKVRKMTNSCQGNPSGFADKVVFCCAEIGKSIMVSLQVTDKSGNKNTCMVEAKVEDKLPPFITCPPNITIDCTEDIEDLDLVGEPEAIDNCEVASIKKNDSGSANSCGEGTINRTWTATEKDYDGSGPLRPKTASCTQRITLLNKNKFKGSDITWPRDYDATTCDSNLDPENLPTANSFPRFTEKPCSQVTYDYDDQVFTFVNGACEKILRTWTVIDWCTYDVRDPNNPNDDLGIYRDVQIIKLTNTIAPEFDSCPVNPSAEVFGECTGIVEQEVNATDDCTDSILLKYSYTIDVDNDGVGPHRTGNSKKFRLELPVGFHKVTWTVEDMCGNKETCMYILNVKDGKKPTPYCLTTITTVVMPSNGMISVWARDFDYGSFDNCTPKRDLVFSFSESKTDTGKVFTCADIPDGIEMFVPIKMYVHDNAGNFDFCSIGIIIQDGIGDVCDDITRYSLSGKIVNKDNVAIKEARMMAFQNGTEAMITTDMSKSDGKYSVDVAEGMDVVLKGERDDHIMNGVSTLDLVLIQRHILGIQSFTSPYDVIASDITNDEKITAGDLVALRKVILGLSSDFPNGQKNWRFIDKSQSFSNVLKPFPYREEMLFSHLNSSKPNMDFVGVKIGDVNGSAKLNARENSTENRNINTLALEYETSESGDYTFVDVYPSEVFEMSGLQFEMSSHSGEIVGIEGGSIDILESEIAIHDGKLRLSKALSATLSIDMSEPIMTIVVKGLNNSGLNFESVMMPEAYNQNAEVYDLKLKPRNTVVGAESFKVLQNTPNPFSQSTTISFELPKDGQVGFEVFDVTGKLLKEINQQYSKGMNKVEIDLSETINHGVLYCRVTFGADQQTIKMIQLK